MEVLFVLLIILAVTRVGAEIAERLGQPSLVGELGGGILLGVLLSVAGGALADTLPGLKDLPDGKVFRSITDLGIFFVMLLAGMELQAEELGRASGKGVVVGFGGLVVPFAAGLVLALLVLPASTRAFPQALFVGTALSITAVPAAVKVLMDLGMLNSVPGQTIISAALFDDILSLILLAVLTAMIETGAPPDWADMAVLAGKVALFVGVAGLAGMVLFPWAIRYLSRARAREIEMSLLLVVALGFAVLAELLGMHFILGSFAAGLFYARARRDPAGFQAIRDKVSGSTYGLLAPVFFASLGMRIEFGAFTETPLFLASLIAVAVFGKLLGAGLPAYWLGLSRREALTVGIGMSGRGAVELVVADVALTAGLFQVPQPTPPVVAHLFSAIVVMAIVTTLAMPIVLRWLLPRAADGAAPDKPR